MTEDWSSRDDNMAIVANSMNGMVVDVVTNGHDETIRARGYEDFHKMWTEAGATSRIGTRVTPPPSPHRAVLIWVCNPMGELVNVLLDWAASDRCVGLMFDITFPWRWPEKIVGDFPDGYFSPERIELIEKGARAAAVVSTSYESLVEPLRELNPNVVHIPDVHPDTEKDWQMGVMAMTMLAGKVVEARKSQNRKRRLWFQKR